MSWLKSTWMWIIGAPVIAAVISILFKRLKRQVPNAIITPEQAREAHQKVEDEVTTQIESMKEVVDNEKDIAINEFSSS